MAKEVIPAMADAAVPVYFITMGNTKFVDTWLEHTQVPPANVYFDQDLIFYNGLKTKRGLAATFLVPQVFLPSIIKKYLNPELWSNFKRTFESYKLSVPEDDPTKGLIQGGTFVFKGKAMKFGHLERTIGDYPDWQEVMAAAVKAKSE